MAQSLPRCAYLGWGLEEASLMDLELRHSQPGKGYEDNEDADPRVLRSG